MWKLFERNESTNTEVWFKEEDNNVHVHQCKISDSPALKLYQSNLEARDSFRRHGDQACAARIDPFTMNTLMISGAAKDPDYMKKYLNTPSNKHLRTTPGKI